MYTQRVVEKLSDIVPSDEYVDYLENIIGDTNLLIDKGYFIEIYINPNGVDIASKHIEETALYYWRHIDEECTYGDLLLIFKEGSIKENTLTFRLIPTNDVFFAKEREKSSPISIDLKWKNENIA